MASDEEFCARTVDELMQTFAVAVRGVMRNLAHTIFTKDISDPPRFNDQQQPVTNAPVDLFQMIHAQVDFILTQTGRRCTPALYDALADLVCDVVGTLQERLLAFLQRTDLDKDGRLLLGEHKTAKDEVYLSAVINSATQCIDHVRDIEAELTADLSRTRRLLSRRRTPVHGTYGMPAMSVARKDPDAKNTSLDDPDPQVDDDSPFDACCSRFVQTAIEASDLLVAIAAQTLPLSKLFGDDWLSGRDTVMADALATLEDFFQDFQTWIMRRAYLGYIVKGCLRTLCAEYVRRFVATTRRTVVPEMLARVKADVAAIRAYFERFATADGKQPPALVAATVETEMRPMLLIESFATSVDADFLQLHLPLIQLTFGTKSQSILEGLLALTPHLSKPQRAALLKQLPLNVSKT